MENKYFTPDITDIRVGYEAEFDLAGFGKEGWQFVKFQGVDKAVRCYHEKGLYRVPYLTQEQIESCGFTLKAKSIDSWFEINEDKRFDTDLQNFGGYKCYNVFLNYGFHDHKLKIKGDFTGGEKFDKAETLFEGECKCINELRQILKQIHITPYYGE